MPSVPPPPPPRRNNPSRSRAAEQPTNAAVVNSESIETQSIAAPLAVGLLVLLLLLMLFCAAGLGLTLAYKSMGSGQSSSDDSGSGASDASHGSTQIPESDTGTKDDPPEEQKKQPGQNADSEDQTGSSEPQPNTEETEDDSGVGSSNASASGGGGTNIPGATFFGISSSGEKIVYVVDCSGSMGGDPLDRAKTELLRSIKALLVSQQFMIIFFDEGEYPMYYPRAASGLVACTDEALRQTESWIRNFGIHGGTDPSLAMGRAMQLRPDSIFLLTDGGFDRQIPQLIHSQNSGRIKINTISFIGREGEPLLQRIASDSGGVYRHIP